MRRGACGPPGVTTPVRIRLGHRTGIAAVEAGVLTEQLEEDGLFRVELVEVGADRFAPAEDAVRRLWELRRLRSPEGSRVICVSVNASVRYPGDRGASIVRATASPELAVRQEPPMSGALLAHSGNPPPISGFWLSSGRNQRAQLS